MRAIRDMIGVRVRDLVHDRVDPPRADRTAYELRLQTLLGRLSEEFGDSCSDAEIRACADAALADCSIMTAKSAA